MSAATAVDLHNPTSAAYKKARKRYLKSTRNRNEQVEGEWTPFRAAEKKYKARFPPPDLSNVLDLASLDPSRAEEVARGWWIGSGNAVQYEELTLKSDHETSSSRKAYIFPNTPGLVLLPSFLSADEQRHLVRWSLCDQAHHPNETNLDTHYVLPEEGLWNKYLDVHRNVCKDDYVHPRASASSTVLATDTLCEPSGPRKLVTNEPAGKENFASISTTPKLPFPPSTSVQPTSISALVPRLRWANIGWSYHWGIKQYDFSKGNGTISDEVRNVCKRAVRAVKWEDVFCNKTESCYWGDEGSEWGSWDETYEPDAGIVNFYQSKDTLMAHVDRSEVCATSPLVSISLGCAAVFLVGGLTRDVQPTPILLRSGDVVIMSGPTCRRAYHGVPRILEGTLPRHLEGEMDDTEWAVYGEYLRNARINVNVRQVFPSGFNPTLSLSGSHS